MRTVVELTGVTARLLTDSNRPACGIMINYSIACMVEIQSYLVSAVVLDHFHHLLVDRV